MENKLVLSDVLGKEYVEGNKEFVQAALNYLNTLTEQLTIDEKKQFLIVCKEFGLNPLKKQIYAVKMGGTMTPIISYYEFIKRADATGLIDYFYVDVELNENNYPVKATFHGKRKDQSHEMRSVFVHKEWSTGKSTWVSKPTFMLEKVAIANGIRRLFPNELADMPYIQEEYWQDFNFKAQDEAIEKCLNKRQAKALETQKESLEKNLEQNILAKSVTKAESEISE